MIVNRYKISNKFLTEGSVGTNELTLSATTGTYKYMTIPVNLSFNPVGNSELITDIVDFESFKAINPYYDGDKFKYKNNPGIKIIFRFFNTDNNNYSSDYSLVGFDVTKDKTKNFFNKSFFRLYFYDDNDPTVRQLLFFEDFDLLGSNKPEIILKNIYWSINDSFGTTNKMVYMLVRFFNAKTGIIKDFLPIDPTVNTPINIEQFNSNQDWWSTPILIINPNNNNGNYNFRLASGNNALILSEKIIL
jgi:hypothetical protein